MNVVDNASDNILIALGLLDAFGGRNEVSTVTTVFQTVGSPPSFSAGESRAFGGTIDAMAYGGTALPSPYGTFSKAAANGLTATLVGERGPEVVMLPGGAQVMNTEGSRSRMKGGGMPPIEVHVHGNIFGIDDLKAEIIGAFSDAWVRANRIHERSVGW